MNLAMLTAVFCCLFMKAPARKCLLYVLMVFRFLAHSLTPFGHESAASGGRGADNVTVSITKAKDKGEKATPRRGAFP